MIDGLLNWVFPQIFFRGDPKPSRVVVDVEVIPIQGKKESKFMVGVE